MKHVLIADDHEVVRRGLKDILDDALGNFKLSQASTAQEAIDLVMKQPFDLVLLDINMKAVGSWHWMRDEISPSPFPTAPS